VLLQVDLNHKLFSNLYKPAYSFHHYYIIQVFSSGAQVYWIKC